jgi:hypothetical protein
MALGARVLKPAEQATSADNFQVYADPPGIRLACAGSSGKRGGPLQVETRLMYVPAATYVPEK